MGVPQNRWCQMEHPIEMDNLQLPPILGNPHIVDSSNRLHLGSITYFSQMKMINKKTPLSQPKSATRGCLGGLLLIFNRSFLLRCLTTGLLTNGRTKERSRSCLNLENMGKDGNGHIFSYNNPREPNHCISTEKSGTIANTTQWVTSLERNQFSSSIFR